MKFRILLIAIAAFAFSICTGLAADTAPAQEIPMKRIEVEEFDRLRQAKTNIVLDVRTEKEFKAGHIPGAVHLDVNAPDFAEQAAKLDKDKTYLVHCTAGVRSRRACKKLDELGFKRLYDLAPGMNGWEKARKPIEKGEAAK